MILFSFIPPLENNKQLFSENGLVIKLIVNSLAVLSYHNIFWLATVFKCEMMLTSDKKQAASGKGCLKILLFTYQGISLSGLVFNNFIIVYLDLSSVRNTVKMRTL